MLYKHSFSILCGHLNLNQKRKKIEFGRLPVKPAGKLVKPTGIPVGTVCTANFEFKFDFDQYRPVSGQTGPVYRYRTRPVWPDRSVRETLLLMRCLTPFRTLSPGCRATESRGSPSRGFVGVSLA